MLENLQALRSVKEAEARVATARAAAEKQAERILADAESEALGLREQAAFEAGKEYEQGVARARDEASREREKVLAEARRAADATVAAAKARAGEATALLVSGLETRITRP
ncbi:MAG: hypothetical protein ACT4PT_08245 [Methanobacteriota archaeon]